jgi:tetratricopeptide (TPR) repeat protein
MGNRSPLAMNLSELLKKLPESGAIHFSANPQVEQAMRAAEAAFSRRDFDEAIKNYSRALELEPGNYSAVLFIGNTYDRQNDFAKAAGWYERAIRLDSNVETAYRYYADMLAKKGDMSKARTMLILAAVAEPYNRIVWRELNAWATLNHTRITEVFVGVQADPSVIGRGYREVRTAWQEGEFRKRFPEEKEYRHSLPEEMEALAAAARILKKQNSNGSLELLLELDQAQLIEPYVLFSLGDSGIARDFDLFRSKNRDKLIEYLDKFVVPPAP